MYISGNCSKTHFMYKLYINLPKLVEQTTFLDDATVKKLKSVLGGTG